MRFRHCCRGLFRGSVLSEYLFSGGSSILLAASCSFTEVRAAYVSGLEPAWVSAVKILVVWAGEKSSSVKFPTLVVKYLFSRNLSAQFPFSQH